MEFLFQLFPIIFFVMSILVFGMIIATTFRGISQWNKNNHSPRLTVDVQIVSKRTEMARYRRAGSNMHRTSTTYFTTFQVESGDRFELQVEGPDYGLLVEGDQGKLTFQGTRFLEFRRA